MSENLGLAFSFRWTHLRQDIDDATFTVDSITATGRQLRSIDAIPLLIHGRYHFLTEGPIRAFAGLGIGISWGSRQFALGPIQQNETGWQFVFAPEIGASYQLSGRNTGNQKVGPTFW